ncbi:MAG: putative sugar-specific transcriptional regulator TrmB family [Clostridiales bacterium]|jgi:sugar-specific transcriptional regulator TrmB|nr:putative sugar-specific transcriptional regulator TrmB family [Clostridiales bacterium]
MFGKKSNLEGSGVVSIIDKKDALRKASEIILSAQKEIFINSNYYLKIFEKELIFAKSKGVRIVMFTFNTPEECDVEIEIYKRGLSREDDYDRHLCLVIDHDSALIYDENTLQKSVKALYVVEPMLVRLIGEHIHHDIYFQKIKYLIGGMDIISKVNIHSTYELF